MSAAFMTAAAPKAAAQNLPQRPHEEKRNRNYAAIVINAANGEVLYSRNGYSRRAPASMTKVMTAYLAFEDIRAGKIDFDTELDVSASAAYKGWTHIHLAPENRTTKKRYPQEVFKITVHDALLGLLVQSGNDVATVLAENLGRGRYPESDFVARMNAKARELGMESTRFTTPSGWPDGFPHSTAMDMTILARAVMRDFPEYYPLFSVEEFEFRDRKFHNHNSLQGVYPGMDGLKTGYTSGSGSNLVASARYGDDRIIAVVFGAAGRDQRHSDMHRLLDFGFARLCDSTLVFDSRQMPRFPCRDPERIEPLPLRPEALRPVAQVEKTPLPAVMLQIPMTAPEKKPLFPFLRKKA